MELAPFIIQQTIPAGTRQSFTSRMYEKPIRAKRASGTVAVNSQFLVQISLLEVNGDNYADDTIPEGVNLFGGAGGQAYITDDGESGALEQEVQRSTNGQSRLCWSINNTDPVNAQPVFVRVEVEEL